MKELGKLFKMPKEVGKELLKKYREDVAKVLDVNDWEDKQFGWMLDWTPQQTSNFFCGKSEIGSLTMQSIAHVLNEERFTHLSSLECLNETLEKYRYEVD